MPPGGDLHSHYRGEPIEQDRDDEGGEFALSLLHEWIDETNLEQREKCNG